MAAWSPGELPVSIGMPYLALWIGRNSKRQIFLVLGSISKLSYVFVMFFTSIICFINLRVGVFQGLT